MKKKWTNLIFGLSYGVYVLAWLVVGLFFFLYDSSLSAEELLVADAETYNLQPKGNEYITTSNDPQFIFLNLNMKMRRVVLKANFEQLPGEMELYYTRSPEQEFSQDRRVWGKLNQDGSYEYTLPAGFIDSLRLDPGSQPQNRLEVVQLAVNPARPFSKYITPNFRNLAAFLLLPALASCVIYTIMEVIVFSRGNPSKPGLK